MLIKSGFLINYDMINSVFKEIIIMSAKIPIV